MGPAALRIQNFREYGLQYTSNRFNSVVSFDKPVVWRLGLEGD